MEGFLIRGLDPILAGWRWLHEPQPISDQSKGLGFHTVRGGIDPGNHRFRPRCVGVVDAVKGFSSGEGPYHLPSSPGGAGSTNPSQLALRECNWGCHAVRGSINFRGPPLSFPVC